GARQIVLIVVRFHGWICCPAVVYLSLSSRTFHRQRNRTFSSGASRDFSSPIWACPYRMGLMSDPLQPPLQSNEPQGPQNPQLPPTEPPKPNDFGMSPNTWAMLTHLSGLLG